MTETPVWTDLTEAWQSLGVATEPVAALRAAVNRDSVRLRWIWWSEVALTLVVLAAFAAALPSLRPAARPWWVLAVLLHVGVVAGFAAWNRRGVWAPVGESTRDYLRLARLRLHRSRRSATFVLVIITVEAAAMLVLRSELPLLAGSRAPVAGVAVLVGVTLAGAVWYRQRQARELERLDRLATRGGWDDPDDGPGGAAR